MAAVQPVSRSLGGPLRFSCWLLVFQLQRPTVFCCVTEHTAEHVLQRFASSNYPQTGLFGFRAEGFMWIGLVSTCSSAEHVSEGGGILMSRFGLLFGTGLGAKAQLILNILLKRLFILMQSLLSGFSCHILVFLNDFPSPHPAVPPLHRLFSCLLSQRPRLAYLQSSDGCCD